MPFSYFSLSLSAAFVFLFAFTIQWRDRASGGGGGHPDPEIRGGGLKTNSVWSKIRGQGPPGSATAIGTPAKAMVS